jgi:hypothetical protein
MELELSCRCGAVHGRLRKASRDQVNRAICYCDDCQDYLRHLGRTELLDDRGGTDIIQVAPDTITFDRGTEKIACVRLAPKGLHRWYSTCCHTPLGNTATAAIPFVGIPWELVVEAREPAARDAIFGLPHMRVFGKFAKGTPPAGSTRPSLRAIARVSRLIIGWKLRRRGTPHPFFEAATGRPLYPIETLSKADRDALRSAPR